MWASRAFFVAAFIATSTGGASAITVDFSTNGTNALSDGSLFSSFDFGGGISGSVTVTGSNANEARVLDTSPDTLPIAPGAGVVNDPDLLSPFQNTTGLNNDGLPDFDFNNALVIQGNGSNGSDPVPDDDANGGVVTFSFDNEVIIGFLDFLDVEEAVTVSLFGVSTGGTALATLSAMVENNGFNGIDTVTGQGSGGQGPNQFDRIDFGGVSGVRRMELDFGGSGALGQFSVVPVPFGLPLLASAFGIAALVRRRSLSAGA